MTDQFVDHDGLRFRCRLDGIEGKPWMVFSNSLVTDLRVWDHQVAAFADRFRILRYDQRGHGGTSVPPGPATIAELADDAAALMVHFGAGDAVFVGVSMGAATGFALAQKHPELVGRLVASDGQAANAPGGAAAWQERIALAEARGMTGYADVTLERWFSARSRAEGNPALAPIRRMIEATPLAGAEDGVMPASMRALLPQLGDARYVEIADAGHIPGIERPEAFNAALEAFLP